MFNTKYFPDNEKGEGYGWILGLEKVFWLNFNQNCKIFLLTSFQRGTLIPVSPLLFPKHACALTQAQSFIHVKRHVPNLETKTHAFPDAINSISSAKNQPQSSLLTHESAAGVRDRSASARCDFWAALRERERALKSWPKADSSCDLFGPVVYAAACDSFEAAGWRWRPNTAPNSQNGVLIFAI